jgi:mannose-6-phosphate isomerase-like protein (cupin superfamily)
VELWHWEVRPGESFGGDAHAPATREMVWVTGGTLTLTVAGQEHRVGPDECARFSGGLPHKYANHGEVPAQLTMIVVVPPAGT